MSSTIAKSLRVAPGDKFKLSKIDPNDISELPVKEKDDAKAQIDKDAEAINLLQDRLYAEGARSLLVILQGTDTSGKDGTVRGVFNAAGPLGVTVTSFKKPSEDELAHDFLWRVHLACPRRGTIGIFNRSQYEDVLVGRVRKLAPEKAIEQRYGQINDFEKMLRENGTTILKFMLHISKDEQAKRLQDRLDEPQSYWKFNPSDLDDRKLWDEYQDAYEIMLNRTSTAHAPWHVIPADRKWARNVAIASIVRATLEDMDPKYPKLKGDKKDYVIK